MVALPANPLTGGAFNPARAFGPELVANYWKNAWVWYVGPLAGGALAAILYELLYLSGRPSPDEEIGAPAELYTPEEVSDAIHDPDTVVIAVPEPDPAPEPPSAPEAPSAGGDEPPPSTPR
jgi:Major intrinsic protein